MVLIAFLLLTFSCFAQRTPVHLVLAQDNDTFPDCTTQFAVNGIYHVKTPVLPTIEIPGTQLVNPVANIKDSVLYSFANASILKSSGSFEFPISYYVPRSMTEMDSILPISDSNYNSYSRYNESYVANQGFVRVPLEITPSQREERVQKRLEELENGTKEMNEDGGNNFYFGNPQHQVLEAFYSSDAMWMQEIPYYVVHPGVKDSVERAHKAIRKQLEPFVDSLLQPFYFSTHEVTNKEYREFVEYVRDSLAVHMVYMEVEDEQAASLLNVSKKELKSLDHNEREANLKKYGWKRPLDDFYDNPDFMPYLQRMYYPQPERFYRRREFDVRKFDYRQNEEITINIYPDTLGFGEMETDSMLLMTYM